jgi:signal transduction histidine kinase
MSVNASLNRTIDWFIPPALLQDRELRTRARMFLFSHMFGPILGNVIPGLLWFVDPGSARTIIVLAGSICCFWIFPFALKYSKNYRVLYYLSIQNLLFAILWGCYYYGGLSSPFLPWLVTVPLLAFFYLGANLKSCIIILLQISASLAIFIGQFSFWGKFPHTVSLADMQGIGIVSIISAAIYVSMMALYYARILASQSEFEKEVRKHIETAKQLREATTQAERANAAKADFLAKMSHELRTPLNAVIGYSQILLEDTDAVADPQGVGDLNKIHDAGHHLLGLVNAILDLSKIEAGKMVAFPEPVEAAAVLQDVAQRWSREPRAKGRTIRVHSNGPLGVVNVDVGKLAQILNALVDNAVRYAPESIVEIGAGATTDSAGREALQIFVRDLGPGIPKALLPTLFETFSDSDDLSANRYSGPGLGLPLAHRLSALIGGSLCVRTSASAGTSMLLTIPRAPTEPEAKDESVAAFDVAA